MASWKKLTRSDIRTFDDRSTEIVLSAMKVDGAEGRVSSRGHAILRAPNGETMSVSRKMSHLNRGGQNIESEFGRIFGHLLDQQEHADEASRASVAPAPIEHPEREVVMRPCTVEGCDQQFATDGAYFTHTRRDHSICYTCTPPVVVADEEALTVHISEEHVSTEAPSGEADEKAEVYSCPECGKEYEMLRFLGAHRYKAHGVQGESARAQQRRAAEAEANGAVFACPTCGAEFDTPQKRGVHRYKAHGWLSEEPRNVRARNRRAQAGTADEVEAEAAEEAAEEDEPEAELPQPPSYENATATFATELSAVVYEYVVKHLAVPADKVEQMRAIIDGLQNEVDSLTKERDDLKARLDLMREALGA